MKPGWPLGWLRERLAYEPRDPALFEAALTHRSASGCNNERLEFLGDAVLNLLAADQLFRAHPLADEGDLSRLRARVVSAEPLASIAQQLALGEALLREYKVPDAKFHTAAFCAQCGSKTPRVSPERGIVVVPAGSLDQDPGIRAAAHIFVADKAPWFEITGDVLRFEGGPPA